MTGSSNRLPVLAADIRAAHEGVHRNAQAAAEHALEAGWALLEAKGHLRHGEWVAWLQEHTGLSARSATRYMQLSRSGMKSATVADLGIKAAAATLSRRRGSLLFPNRGFYAYCEIDDHTKAYVWRPDPAKDRFHVASWINLHYSNSPHRLTATDKPIPGDWIDLTLSLSDFPVAINRFGEFPETVDERHYFSRLREIALGVGQ